MNSKMLRIAALVASIAYGLMVALVNVNTVEIVAGAVVVAVLWVAAAVAYRSEVGPRDRSARAARRSGRV